MKQFPHTAEDRDARLETLMEAYNLLQDLAFLDKQMSDIIEQAKEKAKLANNKTSSKKLTALAETLEEMKKDMAATKVTSAITGEEKLREKIGVVYSNVLGYQGRPTQSQVDRLAILSKQVNRKRTEVDKIIYKDLPNLEAQLAKEEIEPFKITTWNKFLEEDK